LSEFEIIEKEILQLQLDHTEEIEKIMENPDKKLKPICFSHEYSKLLQPTFSTIRRYDKNYQKGQIRWIRFPNGTFKKAEITFKHTKKWSELTDEFIIQDTDCKTRQEALELINSFYKRPIADDEVLTIIMLRWLK
jgi:hypothetical protein